LTLHERLSEARARLQAAGIPAGEAALDADLFARTILGWDRARLIVESSREVPAALEPTFSEWIERCARHEPPAYIVGHREFWGLDFQVTPAVLVPRPETEMIVEAVLALIGVSTGTGGETGSAARTGSPPVARIADIGTGSGCIGISIAHSAPNTRVVATDVSAEALAVALRNAEAHGVADRVEFFTTSYLGGIEGDFDIIAGNPPYVRELDRDGIGASVRYEPEVALYGGENGLLHLEGVLDTAVRKLRPHGWLVMEIGYGQEDDVLALVAARPSLQTRDTRCDLQGIPRTLLIQREDR
jgi:release factor glutamine methyltransferase